MVRLIEKLNLQRLLQNSFNTGKETGFIAMPLFSFRAKLLLLPLTLQF